MRRCSPTRTTSAMLASFSPVATTSGPETLTILPLNKLNLLSHSFRCASSSPPNPLRWAPAGVRAAAGRPYSLAEFPAHRAGKKIKIRAEQDTRLRSTPMLAPPPAGNHPRGRG